MKKAITQHSIKAMLICLLAFTGIKQLNAQNNALEFNGTNSFVNCSNITELNAASQFTFEAMVYSTSQTKYKTFFAKRVSDAINIQLQYYNDFFTTNKIMFAVGDGISKSYITAPNTVLPLNSWHHIAAVYNGVAAANADRLQLYIDGARVAAVTVSGTVPSITAVISAPVYLGAENPGAPFFSLSPDVCFSGKMNDVRIWNVARTAAQVAASAGTCLSGSTTGLLVEYKLDEIGPSTAAINAASSSYVGLLTNFNQPNCWASTTVGCSCTATSFTKSITICAGSSYNFGGTNYSATGTYTKTGLTNANGCDSSATLNLTVISSLPFITGSSTVCVGSTLQLSNAVAGGVWSSLNNRSTVNAVTGLVTGTSGGSAVITYKLNTSGCNLTTTKVLDVNTLPNIPSIGYAAGTANPQTGAGGGFCANKTFTVVGTPSGGVWSKTGVITVGSSTGIVNTGSSAGASTLTYTYTNNGCGSSRTINGNVVVCASRGVNGATNETQETRNEFTIYPNPAKSFISLNVKTLIGEGQIIVSDLYGKQVKVEPLSIGNNTVDIANLAKGIYFVSTITNQGKTTKKLVVE